MKTVLFLFVGLLAAIGFGCLLAALQRWVLKPRRKSRIAVVVPVFGEEDEIEYTLRGAGTSLMSGSAGGMLIIADFGADARTLEVCRMYCGSYAGTRLCKGEDLPKVLSAYAQSR